MLSLKTILTSLIFIISIQHAHSEDLIVEQTVEFEFGEDRGQAFGNVLEWVTQDGKVVGGVGFLDVYNTRFRNDRYKLQFYARAATEAKPVISRHPIPAPNTGLFIFDIDDTIYGWTGTQGTFEWNIQKQQWTSSTRYSKDKMPSGYGGMKLQDGLLDFSGQDIRYKGKLAVALPESGRSYNYYYAEGHLFFFHVDQINDSHITKIYALRWKPGDPAVNDLTHATTITCRYPRTTPFSWGQHQGRVVTVGNYGGIYTFVNGKWIEELEGSDQYSYQVYSHMHFNGVSYMAQYPTGNLFAYEKGEPVHINNWPPKLPQVSGSAREAMSMGIYGGNMYVGVWPWAELWRLDAPQQKWKYTIRGFTHPELTNAQVHPYEQEAVEQNLVLNHWGQRITSLVPLGEHLFMGTSSKGLDTWTEDRNFLKKHQADQYGSLIKLTLPGTITVPIEWDAEPIRLSFRILPDRIEILHQQITIGTAKIDRPTYESFLNATPRKGTGVFSPTDMQSLRLID